MEAVARKESRKERRERRQEEGIVSRTAKVPLANSDEESWERFWQVAYKSAEFANYLMSVEYIARLLAKRDGSEAKLGEKIKRANAAIATLGITPYRDFGEDLGSYVRDAIQAEVQGIWSKKSEMGKIIHHQRSLPTFQSGRAVCVRDRGFSLEKEGDDYVLSVCMLPATNPDRWSTFKAYRLAVEKSEWMRRNLDNIVSGVWPARKLSIVFNRRKKRLMAYIAHERQVPAEADGFLAAVGPLMPPGDGHKQLFVHCEGQEESLTHYVDKLRSLKRDLPGIQDRYRKSLGKARKWRAYRRALLKTRNFPEAAEGILQQMVTRIIKWCTEHRANRIEWKVAGEGELPWARLEFILTYKAREAGITVIKERGLMDGPSTKEDERWLMQAKVATREVRKLIQVTMKG